MYPKELDTIGRPEVLYVISINNYCWKQNDTPYARYKEGERMALPGHGTRSEMERQTEKEMGR